MTSDDKETKPFQADPPEAEDEIEVRREPPPLPRPAPPSTSRWLALIPVTAAVLVFLLMVPRGTTPEDVPLPVIDGRALRVTEAEDDARAASARQTRLSTAVLAVGSAMRELNRSMAVRDDENMGVNRRRLDDALRGATEVEAKNVGEALRSLRAVQLEGFLAEVRAFESSGTASKELGELGGGFVERMTDAGWVRGHTVLLTDAQRRVAYKLVWTALVFGDRNPELALTLDEQRVLYTLYLSLPHVPDTQRISYQLMRRNAATPDECQSVALKEKLASELWRADKIRKLGDLDSSYPAGYALGIAYYRAGRYDDSMNAFHTWMEGHPDGPLAARARNYWKAAWLANGPI